MKKLLATFLFAAACAQAAETPTITISKSDKLAIAVTGLPAADAKVLENDLAMSGYFKIVPQGSATFIANGSATATSIAGTVADRGGKTALSKTFTGSARGKVHQFADEIVETLTGNKGIASSKIAFVATRSGHKEIYPADADGAGVSPLTNDGNISVAHSLSPDGRMLG